MDSCYGEDGHCHWEGFYYYVDCNGDFWMPYAVPADCACGRCALCRRCWCWQGCNGPAASSAEATQATGPTGPIEPADVQLPKNILNSP